MVSSAPSATVSVPAGVVVIADHYRAEEIFFGPRHFG
jgi:hypothetical protein